MGKPTVSSESVAQDQIRAFVERIMRMREEAKAINDDIREIYAEAKGNGFDKTVLGKLVLYVEKRGKDSNSVAEADALFDLYLEAFDGRSSRTHAHEDDEFTGRVAQSGSAPQQRRLASVSGSRPDASNEVHEPRVGSNPTPIPPSTPPASQETTAADPAGEADDASSADQSTAARSDVLGDEGKAGVSPAPDRTLAELEVAPPAGDQAEPGAGDATADAAPPVDTKSQEHPELGSDVLRDSLAGVEGDADRQPIHQSTAPRSDVGDNSTEASGPGQRLDPAAATTPPAGEAPPVDTNSATHHGGSGAIPETAAAPVAEGVSPNASSVTPFLAITAGGQAIEHQGAVS